MISCNIYLLYISKILWNYCLKHLINSNWARNYIIYLIFKTYPLVSQSYFVSSKFCYFENALLLILVYVLPNSEFPLTPGINPAYVGVAYVFGSIGFCKNNNNMINNSQESYKNSISQGLMMTYFYAHISITSPIHMIVAPASSWLIKLSKTLFIDSWTSKFEFAIFKRWSKKFFVIHLFFVVYLKL